VDVTLAYPDGRTGALGVTSHAEKGAQQRDALLAREEYQWPNPGQWTWSIRLGPGVPIKELRLRYQGIITLCEQAGVKDPELLPWQLRWADPDLRWQIDQEVTMRGTHTSRPGEVWVHPEGLASFVDEHLVGLPAAVEELVQVPVIARHIQKLLVHDADEHHLFIIIGHGGLPASLYLPLMREVGALPPAVPALPSGLSHLWPSTGYGPSLLCCSRGGWFDHRVFDLPS
jgi:hypothetical protein